MDCKDNRRIEEKKHRLPREFYKGEVSVAFTLCLRGCDSGFTKPEVVNTLKNILTAVVKKAGCIVPAYCFMPDHQHLIITGMQSDSDVWKTIVSYKQRTGYWVSVNKVGFMWQKDFYDYIIRNQRSIATQVRYMLDNPVRRGLVSSWHEYSFKGSIGCDLENILDGII